MKTVKNVEGLLDVLGDTSVIVIEEKDNKILYLNEKAKEINPELEKDKICDGLWKGQCEYYKMIFYNEVTKEVTDICAVRILCRELHLLLL